MNQEKTMKAYASYPDLQGKRVVVTGGGSGIGADSAARCTGRNYFADAGWYGA
jgi:NADP-dependent 3-hydroxy acid dehydrogenase YdfG